MPEFQGVVVCGFYDQFKLLLDTGESLLLNGFHNKLLKSLTFVFWLHFTPFLCYSSFLRLNRFLPGL